MHGIIILRFIHFTLYGALICEQYINWQNLVSEYVLVKTDVGPEGFITTLFNGVEVRALCLPLLGKKKLSVKKHIIYLILLDFVRGWRSRVVNGW